MILFQTFSVSDGANFYSLEFKAEIEIIIINDASTDSNLKIIQEFQALEKRIKLIKFSKNKGYEIGRNTALKNARGQYI